MKYFRLASLISSIVVLASLVVGTFATIFNFFGMLVGLKTIVTNPDVLMVGFYETLGALGFNYSFWGWNGPFIAVALLFVVLINSIGSEK